MTEQQDYNSFEELSEIVKQKAAGYAVRKLILPLLGGVLPVLFAMLAVVIIFGGVTSVGDSLLLTIQDFYKFETKEEAEAVINDVGVVLEAFNNGDIIFSNSKLAFMDEHTVKRILTAVKEYDEGREESMSGLSYGNREESISVDVGVDLSESDFPPMDQYGNLTEDSSAYSVSYDTNKKMLDILYRSDIEKSVTLDGKDAFAIRWQEILVLCAMAARDNVEEHMLKNENDNFANKDLDDLDMSEYFLTDEEISKMIEIFVYDFKYWFDPIEELKKINKSGYNFKQFINLASGFRIETEIDKELYRDEIQNPNPNGEPIIIELWDYTRTTYRIPDFAPRSASNAFTTFNYIYSDGVCVERQKIVNINQLISECTKYCSSFSMDEFIELLSLLPGTDELVSYYNSFMKTDMGYMPVVTSTTDERECSSIGVIYSPSLNEGDASGSGENGSDTGWEDWEIGTTEYIYYDYIKGAIHRKAVKVDGKDYGIYKVHDTALKSYLEPDNVTEDDLIWLFSTYTYFSNCENVLFNSEENVRRTAQALCEIQEEKSISVLFFLAIMRLEDALSTNKGEHWNFFNIEASSKYGRPGISESPRFCDYTKVCSSPWEALKKEINSIYTWYSENYGQNNAFLFCFMGYTEPDWSKIYHSYCPAWDDCSFPWEAGSGMGSPTGIGWANNVGDFWYSFSQQIAAYHSSDDRTFVR